MLAGGILSQQHQQQHQSQSGRTIVAQPLLPQRTSASSAASSSRARPSDFLLFSRGDDVALHVAASDGQQEDAPTAPEPQAHRSSVPGAAQPARAASSSSATYAEGHAGQRTTLDEGHDHDGAHDHELLHLIDEGITLHLLETGSHMLHAHLTQHRRAASATALHTDAGRARSGGGGGGGGRKGMRARLTVDGALSEHAGVAGAEQLLNVSGTQSSSSGSGARQGGSGPRDDAVGSAGQAPHWPSAGGAAGQRPSTVSQVGRRAGMPSLAGANGGKERSWLVTHEAVPSSEFLNMLTPRTPAPAPSDGPGGAPLFGAASSTGAAEHRPAGAPTARAVFVQGAAAPTIMAARVSSSQLPPLGIDSYGSLSSGQHFSPAPLLGSGGVARSGQAGFGAGAPGDDGSGAAHSRHNGVQVQRAGSGQSEDMGVNSPRGTVASALCVGVGGGPPWLAEAAEAPHEPAAISAHTAPSTATPASARGTSLASLWPRHRVVPVVVPADANSEPSTPSGSGVLRPSPAAAVAPALPPPPLQHHRVVESPNAHRRALRVHQPRTPGQDAEQVQLASAPSFGAASSASAGDGSSMLSAVSYGSSAGPRATAHNNKASSRFEVAGGTITVPHPPDALPLYGGGGGSASAASSGRLGAGPARSASATIAGGAAPRPAQQQATSQIQQQLASPQSPQQQAPRLRPRTSKASALPIVDM